jgi:hypothetical protein
MTWRTRTIHARHTRTAHTTTRHATYRHVDLLDVLGAQRAEVLHAGPLRALDLLAGRERQHIARVAPKNLMTMLTIICARNIL